VVDRLIESAAESEMGEGRGEVEWDVRGRAERYEHCFAVLIKISAESEVSESRGEKSGGFVVAVTEREVCEGGERRDCAGKRVAEF
jgi:hypothetical protein